MMPELAFLTAHRKLINRKPLVAIIQLFCDEGGKYHSGSVVSFSAVLATQEGLENFSCAWENLLRSYGLPSFHMRKLANASSAHGSKLLSNQTINERTDLLHPFADCINKHLALGLVQTWHVGGYAAMPMEAKKRIGGSNCDPHYLAMIRGLLEIRHYINPNDKVSVICDDDIEKAWDCYLHYRAICSAMPELRDCFASLAFAKDDYFPALQAADMVAFLSRLQAEEKFLGTPNKWSRLYSYLTTNPHPKDGLMQWAMMFAGEAELLSLANSLTKPLCEPTLRLPPS